jgi:hypothetical protein
VSIYAASKERSLEDIRTSLFSLVRTFEADAPTNRRIIRELLDNDRQLFYASAIEILKGATDSRGVQYLVALLVANNMLLEALCDPALNREQAVALGRAAVRVDPMADAGLARGLADSETGQGSVVVHDAPRLMEILCEVGDPARMMASMLRLLRHPNPYLRSKAVKVVGRGSKSAKWVRQRMNEPDPRIRANAIEALWSVDTDEARILLQFAVADGNNRVAANALLGLYYLGESSVLADLVKMANHESGLFRASAAWAMGETGDSRFSEQLRRMLSETDQTVRKRAFAAIGRVKTANAAAPAGSGEWDVAARLLAGESLKGTRRVMVAVVGADGREMPKVPSLGVILTEGGAPILSYKVTERPVQEAMSVAILYPRQREAAGPFLEAVETCLKWKRTSDLWCLIPYIETGDGEPPPAGQDADAATFTGNVEALRRVLGESPKRIDCTDLWTAMWRASKTDQGASRGRRHIVVFSSAEEARIAGTGLIVNIQGARLPVHAIASGPNTRLKDFCDAVHAPLQVCGADETGDALRQIYLGFLARYEVAYQPVVADAASLKVRVQAPGGSGETVAAYRNVSAVAGPDPR